MEPPCFHNGNWAGAGGRLQHFGGRVKRGAFFDAWTRWIPAGSLRPLNQQHATCNQHRARNRPHIIQACRLVINDQSEPVEISTMTDQDNRHTAAIHAARCAAPDMAGRQVSDPRQRGLAHRREPGRGPLEQAATAMHRGPDDPPEAARWIAALPRPAQGLERPYPRPGSGAVVDRSHYGSGRKPGEGSRSRLTERI